MSSLLIVHLGGLITGDLTNPHRTATSIYIEDGVIAEIDSRRSDADTIIDANGLLLVQLGSAFPAREAARCGRG